MDDIVGIVVEGQKISRKLGFPTLNIEIDESNPIKYGVYAGVMEHKNIVYQGVMNIGITPSFEVSGPKLEMHIFNFDQDIYGEEIKVTPTHFIRDEMKFDDMDLLSQQIQDDSLVAMGLLN